VLLLRGEGLVDADGTGHDELVEPPEVLGRAGGHELLGTEGRPHGNLFPGVTEQGVLVLVGELGEAFELPPVFASAGVVVFTREGQSLIPR